MSPADWHIRKIRAEETHVLDEFLYEAIFQKEGEPLLPKDVIEKPELKVYIAHFGRRDDHCFLAEADGNIVGAVWVRILAGEPKGYGNIDDKTPEFAISLLKPYRNQGIGTALMHTMIDHLRKSGYAKASLSVEKGNYAYKMYAQLGFEIVDDSGNDYLMVLDF